MWNPHLRALRNQGGKSQNCSWRRHLKKQSTKQLSCVHALKPTRRAFFILFQKTVSWKSSPSVQKNHSTRLEDSSILSNPTEKDFRHSSWFFCSCDTCNCVSVRSKAKQKLMVPVVEWETSKESTSVTESGGETEPSEPQFSLCSELGAAAFPVYDKSPAHSSFQYH